MSFYDFAIPSPKRHRGSMSGWEGFFPYYAGYPEAFVEAILAGAGLSNDAVVFDPWNGSGTTTFAAARRGHSAIGVDLNPVMIAVAKARLLPNSEADSVVPLGMEILKKARRSRIEKDDPLSAWFDGTTAETIRAIEYGIRSRLVGKLTLTDTGVRLENMSGLAAALYVTLFTTCRDLTKRFRASNPTWTKMPKGESDRICVPRKVIQERFLHHLSTLTDALADRSLASAIDPDLCKIRLADSSNFDLEQKSVDFVITSPPYCTRIDYTSATRIELAILNSFVLKSVGDLSREMIGSTRVPLVNPIEKDTWGEKCKAFLKNVSKHNSKASSGYYLRTHLDYFDKIDRSLEKIAKTLKVGGQAILVVQDSHYKDVHNDLPSIISEIAENHGMRKLREKNFVLKQTLAGCHPHRNVYKKSGNAVESVLHFER